MNKISSGIPIWKLSPESLEKLQLKKFMGAVKWAYENSRFLRSLYDDAGLNPEDIRAMEDANSVPKVEKFMMRTIQRKDLFPYSDALCVPIETSRNSDRPAAPPAALFINRTLGAIGNGGLNVGPHCLQTHEQGIVAL